MRGAKTRFSRYATPESSLTDNGSTCRSSRVYADSVHRKVIAFCALTVDGNFARITCPSCVRRNLGNSWGQRFQTLKASAVQRNILDKLSINDSADGAIGRVNVNSTAIDLNGLRSSANVKGEVPAHYILDVQGEVTQIHLLESLFFYEHTIAARVETGYAVDASAVRSGHDRDARIFIGKWSIALGASKRRCDRR